jgi:hypothetical protein
MGYGLWAMGYGLWAMAMGYGAMVLWAMVLWLWCYGLFGSLANWAMGYWVMGYAYGAIGLFGLFGSLANWVMGYGYWAMGYLAHLPTCELAQLAELLPISLRPIGIARIVNVPKTIENQTCQNYSKTKPGRQLPAGLNEPTCYDRLNFDARCILRFFC